MDIKSNQVTLMKVLNKIIGINDICIIICDFGLEYYFIENNTTHYINEKTYLRILAFQVGVYLEKGIRASKRIPRKRRGKKHPIKYEVPSLIIDNTSYFQTYTEAKTIVEDNCINCCCMIIPGQPCSRDKEGKLITITVPEYKLQTKMEHRFPFQQDSRLEIYYSRYPKNEDWWDVWVWVFIKSDPDFMCRVYP